MANRLKRLIAVPLALLAPLLGACSELMPPSPEIQAQVVVSQGTVQVDNPGDYLVGTVQVRGVNLNGSVSAVATLKDPPPGVRLVSPGTITVTSQSQGHELKLNLDPSKLFGANETEKRLSLILRLTAQGLPSAEVLFGLTVRRTGASTPPPGNQPSPSLSLEASMAESFAQRGSDLAGTFTLRGQGGAEGWAAVAVKACSQARVTYDPGPYRLPKDGSVSGTFTVHIPRDAPLGTCQVKVTAYLGNLTTEATTSFSILPGGNTLELQVGNGSIVQGTSAVLLPFKLSPLNGWTGIVDIRVFRGDEQGLTRMTQWRVQDENGNNVVVPDSNGIAEHNLTQALEGYLRLEGLDNLAPGTYTYHVRANDLTRSFTLTVSP